MLEYSAGEFKTHCLKLMDLAQKRGETVVITKRGIPVAKLVPFQEVPVSLFGFMAGSLDVEGDIVSPIDEVWDVET